MLLLTTTFARLTGTRNLCNSLGVRDIRRGLRDTLLADPEIDRHIIDPSDRGSINNSLTVNCKFGNS